MAVAAAQRWSERSARLAVVVVVTGPERGLPGKVAQAEQPEQAMFPCQVIQAAAPRQPTALRRW